MRLRRWVFSLVTAGMLVTQLGAAQGLESLRVMAPASPGGGWDSTSRLVQSTLQATGIVPSVEVFNVSGAGGPLA